MAWPATISPDAPLSTSPLTTLPKKAIGRRRVRAAIETPRLSVVIVNYCQWQNTSVLTKLLRQSEAMRRGAAEIVIVDNHSPKHPARKRLAKLSGVTIHANRANEGFARAVNRGSRFSHGEWILLLNPDCTVPPGFLDEVLETAERWPAYDPQAGVVGFQLRHTDGSPQAGVGRYPTLLRTLRGLLSPRSRRKCELVSATDKQRVSWVTGGCLLVRRDCYEALNGMDEQFFLYYEDVDFCKRAHSLGWSVWYDPSLQVTHHWPLHVRKVPPSLRLVTRHALLTYAQKHWNLVSIALLHSIVWLEASVRVRLARSRHDQDAEHHYHELQTLVREVWQQREQAAYARIERVATKLHETASAQDGKTQ